MTFVRKLTILAVLAATGAWALAALAQGALAASPIERQWELAAQPSIKILVRDKGWYSVSRRQLVSAGLRPGTPVTALHLYADGEEVPIVLRNVRKGKLGPQGRVQFYGEPLDTQYTDTRTYWLVAGERGGSRMRTVTSSRWKARVARNFPFTAVVEPHDRYYPLPGQETDDFFGPIISTAGQARESISTPGFDASSGQPVVRVVIQGIAVTQHQVRIALNGTEIKTAAFNGQLRETVEVPVDANLLRGGENTLTLTALGGDADVSYLDRVEVTYGRTYHSPGRAFQFALPVGQRAVVGGFQTRALRVTDITNPARPRLVRARIRRRGSEYTLTVPATGTRRQLLAWPTGGLRRPALVERNTPSSWNRAEGADLIIIAPHQFLPAVEPLRALRTSQGLRVAVVDVQDVFDEFSYGAHEVEALKAFLARARAAWQPAPRYVLLFGDATNDPRDYLKQGEEDLIPVRASNTATIESISDDWIADENGDGLPELAVGRLPVRTVAEAERVVAKIVGYETNAMPDRLGALFVADANRGWDFESTIDSLRALVPPAVTSEARYFGKSPSKDAFQSELVGLLNGGPALVSYIGHGSITQWSNDIFFSIRDVPNLHNEGRLPFMTAATCLNGRFDFPNVISLGERLIRDSAAGAVGVLASAGLEPAQEEIDMNREFLVQAFGDRSLRVGDIMVRAKTAVPGNARKSEILLADPATKLRLP